MPTPTVTANERTVVHKQSDGIVQTNQDICLTPTPAPTPLPHSNVALSADAANTAVTVLADGGNPICNLASFFAKSTANEGGNAGGGILSAVICGKAQFMFGSLDVIAEGQPVTRQYEMMYLNAS